MLDYMATSKIRRKLKTKVAKLSNRLQSSKVITSLQDLTIENDKWKQKIRKFRCSSSDIEDYDSDNEQDRFRKR